MPQQHRPFANHPCASSHPSLIQKTQLFLSLAIGDSTRLSYTSGVKNFLKFVDAAGITPAFPASVETLCIWISSLAAEPSNLKIGTCKVYLSGVINQHLERGFNNPLEKSPPMLDRIFTGIKRWTGLTTNDNQTHSRIKLPITTTMLRSFAPLLDHHKRSDALVLAMMWLATTAMLRISEFTIDNKDNDHLLSLSQLSFIAHNNTTIDTLRVNDIKAIKHAILHLQASKTDPFRAGVDITIAATETIQHLCSYLAHIKHQRVNNNSPLFSFSDGAAANRSWFMKQVSTLLSQSGYNAQHYTSHSFRKGGAVSLQEMNVADSVIRLMGRWKSDAFNLYVQHPTSNTINNAMMRM